MSTSAATLHCDHAKKPNYLAILILFFLSGMVVGPTSVSSEQSARAARFLRGGCGGAKIPLGVAGGVAGIGAVHTLLNRSSDPPSGQKRDDSVCWEVGEVARRVDVDPATFEKMRPVYPPVVGIAQDGRLVPLTEANQDFQFHLIKEVEYPNEDRYDCNQPISNGDPYMRVIYGKDSKMNAKGKKAADSPPCPLSDGNSPCVMVGSCAFCRNTSVHTE